MNEIYIPAVFPALAGMNRRIPDSASPVRCVPRASGDEPTDSDSTIRFAECSPR